MNIGQVIRMLRIERGLTLERVALDVDTDASNLSRIERGLQHPTEDALKAIALVLGSTVSQMYAATEPDQLLASSLGNVVETEDDLSKDGLRLRRYFRQLNPANKKLALEILQVLIKQQRG